MNADIDSVVIATPGFTHRELVEKAIAAGKHILCEKPVALNMEEVRRQQETLEMIASARASFISSFQRIESSVGPRTSTRARVRRGLRRRRCRTRQ